MQNWIQSSCLFGSRFACAQAAIFFAKPYSINAGEASIVLWIAACRLKISSFRNPNQNRAALWRIFSSNGSAPANRKTAFYANREPNKQEIGFNFAWSGSELWSCFKYSVLKLKNQKHIAVDVLLKGFPMVPLSCRSNLAGQYLYYCSSVTEARLEIKTEKFFVII